MNLHRASDVTEQKHAKNECVQKPVKVKYRVLVNYTAPFNALVLIKQCSYRRSGVMGTQELSGLFFQVLEST